MKESLIYLITGVVTILVLVVLSFAFPNASLDNENLSEEDKYYLERWFYD